MASLTSSSFREQQNAAYDASARHPSQRVHEMDDAEKIYHLQNEVQNLRNRIREANGGTLSPQPGQRVKRTRMMNNSGMGNLPVLSVFLVLGVIGVAIWRRRQRSQRYHYAPADGMTMTFELPDAHDYAVVDPAAASNSSTRRDLSYEAPSTSATVQFV